MNEDNSLENLIWKLDRLPDKPILGKAVFGGILDEYQNTGSSTIKSNYEGIGIAKGQKTLEETKTLLAKYEAIGTPEEILECSNEMEKQLDLLDEYLNIGTPTSINNTLEDATKTLTSYLEFGNIDQVQEKMTRLNKYEALGDSPEQIKQALNIALDVLRHNPSGNELKNAFISGATLGKSMPHRTPEHLYDQYGISDIDK